MLCTAQAMNVGWMASRPTVRATPGRLRSPAPDASVSGRRRAVQTVTMVLTVSSAAKTARQLPSSVSRPPAAGAKALAMATTIVR